MNGISETEIVELSLSKILLRRDWILCCIYSLKSVFTIKEQRNILVVGLGIPFEMHTLNEDWIVDVESVL